ncbi:hypothetical protein ABZ819_04975 [Streptomyces venezuelae]|uniref:hypothetical protein n=1 Tax=Streptomyces venezuelae TaxID=54571 RepID=UPI00343541CF
MNSTAKPPPAHGSYARANGCPGYREPCKCDICHPAFRRARKQYNVNRQLGRPGLVDATPAREHLQKLQLTMTWGQIVAAGACEARNLQLIADGRRSQIRRSTLTKILAVTPQPPAPGKYVDATGLRRRLQALRVLGWSACRLADAASSAEARIQLICSGEQPTVRQVLAVKILKVYEELSQIPAPPGRSATRTTRHALANGWAPPSAWDDDTIDDPTATPDFGDRVLNFRERAALRREEIIHFAWHGDTPEQILERLDHEVSIATVRQVVAEWRTGKKRDRSKAVAA